MPLPALYQMLSILFFLSGCFWVFILKKNGTEQVVQVKRFVEFITSLPGFPHTLDHGRTGFPEKPKLVLPWGELQITLLFQQFHLIRGI